MKKVTTIEAIKSVDDKGARKNKLRVAAYCNKEQGCQKNSVYFPAM